MVFRLNRTRETSREEFRTNQNAQFCDVTYLLCVGKCRCLRHCLFREAPLKASSEDSWGSFLFLWQKSKVSAKMVGIVATSFSRTCI